MVLKKRKRFSVYGGRAGEEHIGKHAVSLTELHAGHFLERQVE